MISICITGQIASGKSTLAKQCEMLGARRFDADKAVHSLLGKAGDAVELVASTFPDVRDGEGGICRTKLSAAVFGEDAAPDARETLENILHPLVYLAEQEERAEAARRRRVRFFVSEIPLLFEAGYPLDYDLILLTHVSPALQRARVMAREGMTEEKIAAILARQCPVREAAKRADLAINTGQGKAETLRALKELLL